MKTKIVATIGPASDSELILREMILAGVNVARLNFSHGSHPEHQERIRRINLAAQITGKTVAIMLDTKGPEIRVRDLNAKINITVGEKYTITAQDTKGENNTIPINYKGIENNVELGNRILIDDGNISLMVLEIKGETVICQAENSGEITSRKGVNIPGREVDLPPLTQKDKEDLLFGIKHNVDFIAASFIRNAAHVIEIKEFLTKNGKDIPVIAKIESRAGIDNLEEIIKVADGIMVARGDLGVEIPLYEVPLVQKKMIKLCNQYAKPVITATQMLESMTKNPGPTRAEATDIANAIFDGTDAIMLSGETAAGKYPLAAVKTMGEIATAAETELDYEKFRRINNPKTTISAAIGYAAVCLAEELQAKAIIIPTSSGATPGLIARFRPRIPMIVTTPNQKVCKALALTWGVNPLPQDYGNSYDSTIANAIATAKEKYGLKIGDLAIITVGTTMGSSQKTNSVMAINIT
ncbi:MAG: pyruvate kinase [Clostridiales bacterium]